MWSATGVLQPGVTFVPQQSVAADPTDTATQQIQFTYQQGAFKFESGAAVGNPAPGSLYIRDDGTIPTGQAGVGIGMSGAAVFAVPAEPNLTYVFTPHPAYRLAAGTFTQGEVLDVAEIADAVQIGFPAGVTSQTATLNADNTWTVTSP